MDMDYTCFNLYLCKKVLEWDFGSNYTRKVFFSQNQIEIKYYIVLF